MERPGSDHGGAEGTSAGMGLPAFLFLAERCRVGTDCNACDGEGTRSFDGGGTRSFPCLAGARDHN